MLNVLFRENVWKEIYSVTKLLLQTFIGDNILKNKHLFYTKFLDDIEIWKAHHDMENVDDAIIIVKCIKIHIPPQKHSIITQYLNILTANIRS